MTVANLLEMFQVQMQASLSSEIGQLTNLGKSDNVEQLDNGSHISAHVLTSMNLLSRRSPYLAGFIRWYTSN